MNNIVRKYLDDLDLKLSTFNLSFEEVEIQQKVLHLLAQLELISPKEDRAWEKRLLNSINDEHIDSRSLTSRSSLSLSRAGINTHRQLREAVLNRKLLNIRNIGNKCAEEIISYCLEKDIIKKDELPEVYTHFVE